MEEEEEQEEEAAGSLPALRGDQIFWNTVKAPEERYVTSPRRSLRLGKRKKATPPPPPAKKAARARLRAHAAHAGPLKKAKASLSLTMYYLNCHTTPVPALWRAHTLPS